VSDHEYLLDNRAAAAGARLHALAAVFDATTFRHIDALGVEAGSHCWEVGAGGDSVVRGLAARCGPSGRVLATDIEVGQMGADPLPGVEVRRHDVGRDAPPDEAFDLVHARLVLVHVTARDAALRSMAQALRPGGWLLVEDADPALQPLACLDPATDEEHLANRIRTGFRQLMAARGAELAYGRTLPGRLRRVGLVDVAADAYFPVALPACNALEAATIALIRDDLVEHGIASAEDLERHLAAVAAGRLDLAQPPLVSAWGRRPAD